MSQTEPNAEDPVDGPERAPLHSLLTYRLSRVQAKLNAQAVKLLRESVGLTLVQWRVIALVGAAGDTRLSDLAKEAVLDKGLLSRNLKTLIDQGLIQSTQDELDHRVQHLSLSPEGQAVYERALPITGRRQDWLRKDLTEEEIKVFFHVLEKLEIAADREEF